MKICGFFSGAAALAATASLSSVADASGQADVRAVVVSDQVPGLAEGVGLVSIRPESVRVNSLGGAAFRGFLTGPGVTFSNGDALLVEFAPSSLTVIAREGNQAPGLPAGVEFAGFQSGIGFNASGAIAFKSFLRGSGVTNSNDDAMFSSGGGAQLRAIARSGDSLPGLPADVTILGVGATPQLSDDGRTVFYATLTGTGIDGTNREALFSVESTAQPELIARTGDPVPSLDPGVVFVDLVSRPPQTRLSEDGLVAIYCEVGGTGVTSADNLALFGETSGSGLELLARRGSQAAGLPAGVTYVNPGTSHQVSASGAVVFPSVVAGSGISFRDDQVIFAKRPGGVLDPAAREGDQVPGRGTEVVFSSLSPPAANRSGRIAFGARIDGPELDFRTDGVLVTDAGDEGLRVIATEGDDAAGFGPGVFYSDLTNGHILLSDAGQVVFMATVFDNGGEGGWNALFATDSAGALVLVASERRTLDVDSGPAEDLRTIESLDPGDPGETLFDVNESGHIAFHAAFTDGTSGVFVAQVQPPAPDCTADFTTDGANPGDPAYGTPDGSVTTADLTFFVEQWLAGAISLVDVTTSATNPGDAGYGVPDGQVNTADLTFYVELWLAGCP